VTDSEVSIGLLLPEVLGTYSDAGNATVLAQRLRWRGLPARVLRCGADQPPPTGCDIYLIGGGEDTAQTFAAEWLRAQPGLLDTLANTATTLAVCAGLQILGESMTDRCGRVTEGARLLDLSTVPRRRRATGEIVTACVLPEVGRLCGFENHGGATRLGAGLTPLGRVLTGVGNGDRRAGGDGVLTERVVGTYLHGPVLARNPALADYLLSKVTGRTLPPLDIPDQAAQRAEYLDTGHRGKRWSRPR
jgi:lipid II isoglutaminyl synthase (glutamine-hydrolysing)